MWSIDTLIRYPLLGSLQPGTMVFLEHLLLVLIFVPLLYHRKFKLRKISTEAIFSFFVIGAIGSALATLAFTKAFSLINPSLVILLQKLQPVLVIFLSALVLKEKIHRNFYFFAAIAILGGLLVSYPDLAPLLHSSGESSQVSLGYFLTLLAVAGWAASTVYGKKLGHAGFSETEIMAGRFVFGFVTLLALCTANQSLPSAEIEAETYLKIAGMVLISGLLGMYLYYRGLKLLSAHIGSIAELFFPISAVLINWIFLGKTLELMQIAGAIVLIIASVGIHLNKKTLV